MESSMELPTYRSMVSTDITFSAYVSREFCDLSSFTYWLLATILVAIGGRSLKVVLAGFAYVYFFLLLVFAISVPSIQLLNWHS